MTDTTKSADMAFFTRPILIAMGALALVALACWIIAAVMGTNLSFDQFEASFWGREWVTVSTKHPTISGWIQHAWQIIFGPSNWAGFGISFANALISILLYALLLRQLGFSAAAATVVFWLFLTAPNWALILGIYNANSATLPFWLLTMIGLSIGARRGHLWAWALAGLAAGVAMLIKYHTLVLVGSAFLWLLAGREERALWRTAGPYVCVGFFALLVGIHLGEQMRWGWPTFGFTREMLTLDAAPLSWLYNPLKYGLIQVLSMGVGLALIFGLRAPARLSGWTPQFRFLFFFGLVFPLAPALVSLIAQGNFGNDWGISASLLILPLALAHLGHSVLPPRGLQIWARRAGLIALTLTLTAIIAGGFDPRPSRNYAGHWQAVSEALDAQEHEALTLVHGRSKIAWAATWYLPSRPHFLVHPDPATQPWTLRHIDAGDLALVEGRGLEALNTQGLELVLVREILINLPETTFMGRPKQAVQKTWLLARVIGNSAAE